MAALTVIIRLIMIGYIPSFAGHIFNLYMIGFIVLMVLVELSVSRFAVWFYILNYSAGKAILYWIVGLLALSSGVTVSAFDIVCGLYLWAVAPVLMFVSF